MEADIWSWSKGKIKVFAQEPALLNRIRGWKKAKRHCQYYLPGGGYAEDFIMDAYLYDKVAAILGLPKKSKSAKRVNNGKKLAEQKS